MLLAAGAGSRLRPLTDRVPKPLAPVGNVPLLERTLSWLAGQGVTDVMVNLHHHAEQISGAIGDGGGPGLAVSYSVEEELLGTGGAVHRCAKFFAGEPFFVVYGDNLIDVDLRLLSQFHEANGSVATIGLFTPDDPSASGMVDVDGDGRVLRFVEKPRPGESNATLANSGIYVLDETLLSAFPAGYSDFGKDLFPAWLAEGKSVYGVELGGYLQDTGTPDRYRKANWDVLAGGLRYSPRGARVGDTVIGDNANISPDAEFLGRNIIGDDCVIGGASTLIDCIVWRGATVGRECELVNVIVGEGTIVADGTRATDAILV
jgi:mannose-1-phosphate guanylyltransferase